MGWDERKLEKNPNQFLLKATIEFYSLEDNPNRAATCDSHKAIFM